MKYAIWFYVIVFKLYGAPTTAPVFQLGVENIHEELIQKYQLTRSSVGLVTNQTGCDQQKQPTVRILQKKGIKIVAIFAPEHGYTGDVTAGQSVENSIERETGIPIFSLYCKENGLIGSFAHNKQLNAIDTLFFDIQDSGMRHYTYISTLLRCLEIAAAHNKKIFVLDRPNILGDVMEGPLVDNDLISFISIASIPLRHGMTIGEIALYFNNHILAHPADLHVIPMKGYTRQASRCLLAPLSPNLKTIQACYGYSFLGLLGEIHPFDIGIGTPDAFQCIMLPRSHMTKASLWKSIQQILLKYNITSTQYSMFSQRKNEYCDGVRIHINEIQTVHSLSLLFDLIALFRIHGITLSFAATFDKAIGTKKIRTLLDTNTTSATLKKVYRQDLQKFHQKASPLFLYKPHPRIVC